MYGALTGRSWLLRQKSRHSERRERRIKRRINMAHPQTGKATLLQLTYDDMKGAIYRLQG